MTQFYGKTKICYGEYALETLETLPTQIAFMVTDPFMVASGFSDRVKSHLDRKGVTCHIFSDVEPDPSVETVTKATQLFLEYGADTIIALGGGSAIDAAKGVAYFGCLAKQAKLASQTKNAAQSKPLLIAIPTTAGTGSEVTAISVLTDTVHEVKIPLNDELLIPDIAILDARFTLTVPPPVTAATGMDVLTHAVEAYTSRQANSFTDIYAEQAISYVFTYLYRAYENMGDMEARKRMQLGSCMAGMAFNNSGLGITHSIAHSLGGLFHVPHGLANAVLLPYIIRYNSFDVGMKYQNIAKLLSLPAKSVAEGVSSLIDAIVTLNASMGIPAKIRDLKIDRKVFEEHLDSIATNALEDFCTGGNPRSPSRNDIKSLLESAW